jgi:hypothetical protein
MTLVHSPEQVAFRDAVSAFLEQRSPEREVPRLVLSQEEGMGYDRTAINW